MLHRTHKVTGYHIHATNGPIGHVDDFLFDEAGWGIKYLVVDTSNWIGGRSVLIATTTIEKIDSPGRQIYVKLTREQIQNGPTMDSVQIELIETMPAVWL
jgi:hypothetical protein